MASNEATLRNARVAYCVVVRHRSDAELFRKLQGGWRSGTYGELESCKEELRSRTPKGTLLLWHVRKQ